jgi:hypothetical protein
MPTLRHNETERYYTRDYIFQFLETGTTTAIRLDQRGMFRVPDIWKMPNSSRKSDAFRRG